MSELCTIKGLHTHTFNGSHADLTHLQGDIAEPRPTWCRMHGAMDHDPEHCALCGGYFHSGPCSRPTSTARDGDGSMLDPRWRR